MSTQAAFADPISDLQRQIEDASQDERATPEERVARMRALRARVVHLLGTCDTYIANLEKLREAHTRVQVEDVAVVRENADARVRMIEAGEASAEDLTEAGFLSHEDLDMLQEEGLLEEAAPQLVARTRHEEPAAEGEVEIGADTDLTEALSSLAPGGVARLPGGATIRRTSTGAQRFKLRDGTGTRTVSGLSAAARAVTEHLGGDDGAR